MEVITPMVHLSLLGLISAGGSSVTGLASGTPENETMAYAHEFALTLSTTLTCNKSLPAPCTANDNGLNVSNWEAFSVSLTCLVC